MKNVAIVGSGADGLALLSKLKRVLIADYVYYADDVGFYLDGEDINLYVRVTQIADFLVKKYETDTVILSNADASCALLQVGKKYDFANLIVCRPPFKQAAEYSASGILVATDGSSPRQEKRYEEFGKAVAFPQLVKLIENDRSDKEVTAYLENCLKDVDYSFDCVVLANSLFSVKKHCFSCAYPSVKVFDSVDGAVAGILRSNKRKRQTRTSGSLTFEFAPSEEKNSEKYFSLLQKISKYY